jgi:hypothetical protein
VRKQGHDCFIGGAQFHDHDNIDGARGIVVDLKVGVKEHTHTSFIENSIEAGNLLQGDAVKHMIRFIIMCGWI